MRALALKCHRTVDFLICLLSLRHKCMSQCGCTVQIHLRMSHLDVSIDEVFERALLESLKCLRMLDQREQCRKNLRDKTIILELESADQAGHHLAVVDRQQPLGDAQRACMFGRGFIAVFSGSGDTIGECEECLRPEVDILRSSESDEALRCITF